MSHMTVGQLTPDLVMTLNTRSTNCRRFSCKGAGQCRLHPAIPGLQSWLLRAPQPPGPSGKTSRHGSGPARCGVQTLHPTREGGGARCGPSPADQGPIDGHGCDLQRPGPLWALWRHRQRDPWAGPGAGWRLVPEGPPQRCSSGAPAPQPRPSRACGRAGGPHHVALQALTILQPHGVDLTGLVTLANLQAAFGTSHTRADLGPRRAEVPEGLARPRSAGSRGVSSHGFTHGSPQVTLRARFTEQTGI